MPERSTGPVFRVRFDPVTFEQDLKRVRGEGRTIAHDARQQLERDGVPASLLAPCQSEARDGTDLAGLVKLYLPIPYGAWGLVLAGERDPDGPLLLSVSERHRPDCALRRDGGGSWPAASPSGRPRFGHPLSRPPTSVTPGTHAAAGAQAKFATNGSSPQCSAAPRPPALV